MILFQNDVYGWSSAARRQVMEFLGSLGLDARLAFRNVVRQKRRSAMALAAVVFGAGSKEIAIPGCSVQTRQSASKVQKPRALRSCISGRYSRM